MEKFDHDFYISFYPDLKDMTADESYQHFLNHGKNEKRICSMEMLSDFQIKNKYRINKEHFNNVHQQKKINILIRTSNRPEYFKNCIESVLQQHYENYQVYICFDKNESLKYLSQFIKNTKIEFFPIHKDSEEKYKFNLYCNDLLDKINNGYVIFLDDDDKFCHNQVLNILNNIIDKKTLLLWKFLRSDKLIYPINLKNIKLGEIDTSGFIGYYNLYKNCRWWDQKNGDYNFINQVIHKNNPKIKLLDKLLVKTQSTDKIGNLGN